MASPNAMLYSIVFTILILETIYQMSDAIYDGVKNKVNEKAIALALTSGAALIGLILIYRHRKEHYKKREILENDEKEVQRLKSEIDHLRGEIDELRDLLKRGRGVSFTNCNGQTKSCLKSRSRISLYSDDDYYTDADEEWSSHRISPTPQLVVVSESENPVEQSVFERVDSLFEQLAGSQEQYDTMKAMYDSDPENPEVLYRLARACHVLAAALDKKNPAKKEKILEGRMYGQKAAELAPDNFQVLKWAAGLTGGATDYLGTKEKIEQGYVFQNLLNRALSQDPRDAIVLHMRGRFKYEVFNLSWLEKKAAAAFFATPPTATIEEALEDFILASDVKSNWPENLLWLGKAFLCKKDKASAAKAFKACMQCVPKDDGEKNVVSDATQLLKSC